MSSAEIVVGEGVSGGTSDVEAWPRPLRVLDLVWSAALIFALSFAVGLLFALYLGLQGLSGDEIQGYFDLPENQTRVALLGFVVMFVGGITFLTYFARRRGLRLRDLGIQKTQRRYLTQAIISLPLVLLAGAGLNLFLDPLEAERLGNANNFVLTSDGPLLLASIVFVVVLIPFVEELFFRAALFGAFAKHMPAFVAAFLTTCCFAVIHTQYVDLGGMAAVVGVFRIFLLGGLLSWFYVRSRSIWPPFLLHAANNATAFAVILSVG